MSQPVFKVKADDVPIDPMVMRPRCQHCGDDPAQIMPTVIRYGSAMAVVLFCGNPLCRAVFAVQPMNSPTPQSSLVI